MSYHTEVVAKLRVGAMDSILSVFELTSRIKKILEPAFPSVSVKGEISNCREQASGHLYFTLKDSEAQIPAVLFRGNSKIGGKKPKDGDEVIIRGELSLYAPQGKYQLIVRELSFSGVGALLAKLHALKLELQAKGWLDPSRKKKIPLMPKTIGVITSPTGAVIQDIIHVLSRRFPNFHLILNPVKVQGAGAAEEIGKAIEEFNRHQLADVLIVGRGGGSIEDLWAFNEMAVLEAIYRSQIPIISAVGHETDFTLADFVADVRAPTPSAAAECVIQEKRMHQETLLKAKLRLSQSIKVLLTHWKERIESLSKQQILSSPYGLIQLQSQKLDDLSELIDFRMKNLLQEKKRALSSIRLPSLQQQIDHRKKSLLQLQAHLDGINPKNLLKKGFSILFHEKTGSAILSVDSVRAGDEFTALLHDGSLRGKIL